MNNIQADHRVASQHSTAFRDSAAFRDRLDALYDNNQHQSLESCVALKTFLPIALAFLATSKNSSEEVAHFLMGKVNFLPPDLARFGHEMKEVSPDVRQKLFDLLRTHRYNSGIGGWFGKAEPADKTIAKLQALNERLNPNRIEPTASANSEIAPLNDVVPLTGKSTEKPVNPNTLTLTVEEQAACESAKLTDSESQQVVKLFRDERVPLNINTVPRHFRDLNTTGEEEVLGKGAFNQVVKVEYKGVDGGPNIWMAFKKENRDLGRGAEVLGIEEENPQFGIRNVATYKLSQRLGLNVIPQTEFAIHKGKLGIVMGIVPGEPAVENWNVIDVTGSQLAEAFLNHKKSLSSDPNTWKNQLKLLGVHDVVMDEEGQIFASYSIPHPNTKKLFAQVAVQWNLIDLEWLDVLTAQSDRHDHNILVYRGTDKIPRCKGIDNDQCFGSEIRDIRKLREGMGEFGFFIAGLPGIASRKTYTRLMKLERKHIQEDMCGLPIEEIDATVWRLAQIKEHLKTLKDAGKILGPDKRKDIRSSDGYYMSRALTTLTNEEILGLHNNLDNEAPP